MQACFNFHCLSLTCHCLSLTFHCLSLTSHCLFKMASFNTCLWRRCSPGCWATSGRRQSNRTPSAKIARPPTRSTACRRSSAGECTSQSPCGKYGLSPHMSGPNHLGLWLNGLPLQCRRWCSTCGPDHAGVRPQGKAGQRFFILEQCPCSPKHRRFLAAGAANSNERDKEPPPALRGLRVRGTVHQTLHFALLFAAFPCVCVCVCV